MKKHKFRSWDLSLVPCPWPPCKTGAHLPYMKAYKLHERRASRARYEGRLVGKKLLPR